MERVVSEAVSTRTAMGFGRGEGRRRGLWQVYTWAFELKFGVKLFSYPF